jgi:alpha-ketoglutarate-dependent taurine dioxygenase
MENQYKGVTTRALRDDERAISSSEPQTPLVIEPLHSKNRNFLKRFMKENSCQIISDIERYGAVLFRGFDIHSAADFEEQVLSIQGMRGMSEFMMSEPGRITVSGTRHVIHPNVNFKTGGTLDPVGGIHSESYYVPDVPRFISFFCEKPPLLGGETGLFDICKIYNDLPERLKEKLEQQRYLAGIFSIWQIAKRYDLPYEVAKDFCEKIDMSMVDYHGDQYAFMYKPSVAEHPTTKEKSIIIHFAGELNGHGLTKELIRQFSSDYASFKWCIHRLVWSFPYIRKNLFALRHPIIVLTCGGRLMGRVFDSSSNVIPSRETDNLRVGNVFEKEDIQLIAKLMRKYHSSFPWKRGDFIIIDNLKLAHAGMPGLGSRIIKVLMCNPLNMTYGKNSSGLYKAEEAAETRGAEVIKCSSTCV